MKPNYKKLLEQDPDFRDFCASVVLDVFAGAQPDFIGFIKSMYDIGNSPQEVARVIQNMIRMQGGSK